MILAVDHSIPFIGISYGQKTSELLEEMNWSYRYDVSASSTNIISSIQKIESEYESLSEKLSSFHKEKSTNYYHILSTVV